MNGHPDREPLNPLDQREQAGVDKVFMEFWLPIIKETNATPILGMNLEQIKRELSDWYHAMHEVAKVYCHITNNKMSKPNYIAEEVIFEYERTREKEIEEAIEDFREEQIEPLEQEILTLKDKVRRLQKQVRTRRANKRKK